MTDVGSSLQNILESHEGRIESHDFDFSLFCKVAESHEGRIESSSEGARGLKLKESHEGRIESYCGGREARLGDPCESHEGRIESPYLCGLPCLSRSRPKPQEAIRENNDVF